MKFSLFILAMHLLALTLVPCTDRMEVGALEAEEISILVSVADRHSGEEEHPCTDECSVLCVCDCCHTHLTVIAGDILEVITVEQEQALTSYRKYHSRPHPHNMLRPPRIA